MRPTLSLRRGVGVLYAGILAFVGLAAFASWSIWNAWETRSEDARTAAVFELVAERTPPRSSDAPGAMAWLRLELDRFGLREADHAASARYASFAARGPRVPDALKPLLDVMRAAPMPGGDAEVPADALSAVVAPAHKSLRDQGVFVVDDHPVVVTRRHMTADAERAASDAFVRGVAASLVHASAAIDQAIARAPLPPVIGAPPRPVRLYAVSEDGTLVSAPWRDGTASPGAAPHAAADELALLSGRPGHPAFAPDDFFFDFDPAAPEPAYSGFYLDVGGHGLVATILVPFPDGPHGVLALDLQFAIDWPKLARTVAHPVIGAAVNVDGPNASWATFATLTSEAPSELRAALAALANRPQTADDAPLRHGIVDPLGAVAAFQVSDRTWLLMLFPRTSPAFPITPIVLLAGLLALLFAGFELNRRRADAERRKAERAFAEKQNLLDTMQVPLVVVDPNTDVIVSSNRAAEAIGVRAGSRFAELVWPEAQARAHYQRMQEAMPAPRRAYGLPVAIRDDDGHTVKRYAVVRSVAVTAQIEALAADERHRLGVLFVLDREADLGLIAADIAAEAHRDERRRLAGLLSHGVDALARVLEHLLRAPDRTAAAHGFAAWLSEYLERRLTVTAWLLDHWDAAPPVSHHIVIDAAQANATLARLTSVFEAARRDRTLRARLHWDNGTLSGSGDDPVLAIDLDWPADYVVTCPVRGGFGLFLSELVTNAVRHGRPASQPRVRIGCDRVRKELTLRIDNAIDPSSAPPGPADAYGGLSIVRAMARLFGWHERACGPDGERFVAEWSMPTSEQSGRGDAD